MPRTLLRTRRRRYLQWWPDGSGTRALRLALTLLPLQLRLEFFVTLARPVRNLLRSGAVGTGRGVLWKVEHG
jgi:hypothetical protein